MKMDEKGRVLLKPESLLGSFRAKSDLYEWLTVDC